MNSAVKCWHIFNWYYLAISIGFEVTGTISLKMSTIEQGFHPWFYMSNLIAFMIFSKALECIPLDIAYALWSAIGTLTTFGFNQMLFEYENVTTLKVLSLTLISLGLVL